MKRLYLLLFFFLQASLAYSQADAGPDKVICTGSSTEVGKMREDPSLCYSWKASPADPAVANARTAKITVNPTRTTTYTLTVIGQEFISSSNDDVKVTVIDAVNYTLDFEGNPGQNFGFDKAAGSSDIYLSIDKNGTTKVNVTVTPFTADAFCVTSSDPGKIKVPNDSVLLTGATTVIDVSAQNAGSNHESALLEVRCVDTKGTVLKTLHVELYKKKTIDMSFYRIVDGTSAGTVPRLNPGLDAIKTEGNSIYKQAVMEITTVQGNSNLNIPYDKNRNGYLDFYIGGANPEMDEIKNTPLPGDPKIAYISKLKVHRYLAAPVNANAQTIRLIDVLYLDVAPGRVYYIGPANGAAEQITIVSVDATNKTVTLAAPLTSAHDITQTIFNLFTGGLADDPQIVTDAGLSETVFIRSIILHEVLHRMNVGNLLDLNAPDNVMNYSTLGGVLLRYRPLPRYYNPPGGTEMQWNTIPRN